MSTVLLNITLTNAINTAEITNSDPQKSLANVENIVRGIKSGAIQGSVDVHTSSTSPTAAAGTITLTYANIDADDTVTIGGVTLTAKASDANGTTQFDKETDATVTAENLVACINANTTLSKHVLASNVDGVVTVTARQKGSIGNLIVLATSDATAFALVAMTGGAGGSESAATTHA